MRRRAVLHTQLGSARDRAVRRIGEVAAEALRSGAKPALVARAKDAAMARLDTQDHEDRRCLYCGKRSGKNVCASCQRDLIDQAKELRS